MKILGIETSCDETAVAIVDDEKNILAHALNSQIELHKNFGGVVPELAARSHAELINKLILEALKQANLTLADIDGFAATSGPGLIGGVIVGMMAAKTLASVFDKPFLAVNHLEAHALTARLTSDLEFPYLLLLVSGGHCQILLARGVGDYKKFGETIDDAVGEAFDKVAKMLGLGYPGGVEVENLAKNGDEKSFKFPRPLIDNFDHQRRYDFSFSGLKTAVRREIEKSLPGTRSSSSAIEQVNAELELRVPRDFQANICASFQRTVAEILENRLENVWQDFDEVKSLKKLVIAGGVAANRYIFAKLQNWASKRGLEVVTPPLPLCTDNAAMVAWAGVEKLKMAKVDSLDFKPKARWELVQG